MHVKITTDTLEIYEKVFIDTDKRYLNMCPECYKKRYCL